MARFKTASRVLNYQYLVNIIIILKQISFKRKLIYIYKKYTEIKKINCFDKQV